MEKYLGKKDVVGIFSSVRDKIRENKAELIRLDSELGDGDLGLTMDKGFTEVVDNFSNLEKESNLGIFFKKAGLAMAKAVPSTMGTFLSLGLIKAGDAIMGKESITLEDAVEMLKAAIGIMVQKGKAKKRGDKTILDAFFPALDELEKACARKETLAAAFAMASEGAKKGAESTKLMKSTTGKAAIYGEKSIGKQDPGATVGMFIFEGITAYLGGTASPEK